MHARSTGVAAVAATGREGSVAGNLPQFGRQSGQRQDAHRAGELEDRHVEINIEERATVVGERTLGAANPGAEIPLDPCQCVDASCRQQWVEVNLGCNVCAVFSCGEQNIPHSCNACL